MASYSAIARVAGLSVSTVSRYLKGELTLKPDTESKILEAMRTLGATPPTATVSHTVIIIVPELANPYFASLAEALSYAATARGLEPHITLSGGDTKNETDIVSRLLESEHEIYGAVYVGMSKDNPHLDDLAARFPVVVADEPIERTNTSTLPFIGADNFAGAFQATNYLISMGHTQIAHIGGPTDLLSARQRQAGYEAALTANSLEVDPAIMFHGPYSEKFGASVLTQFKQLSHQPTAAFISSDIVAIGVISAASQYSIRVPEDLSLIGFDGIKVGAWLRPQLTTIAQPISDIAHTVFAELTALRNGHTVTDHALPMELTIRESVIRQTNTH
ncbi:LacI family DNA-binding transcriptional regulator [Timonella sp. A28]|uniref:LacI family DNA-binding transcriptional regulator n=1 Tax=Timonella sp. A28 TaxID=3442640 RepID=UPI003EBA44EE